MTDHDWRPCVPPDVRVEAAGVIVYEPDDERRWSRCSRCGSRMSVAAYGEIPTRSDLSFFEDPSVPLRPPRKISGWETMEQGMARCGVSPDCDVATAARVMES